MSVIDSRVINIDELKLEHFAKGDKFEARSARIGPPLGAKDLGYSYDVVPPGKRLVKSSMKSRSEPCRFSFSSRTFCALRTVEGA